MAYSSIIIDFISMPTDGKEININESSLGLNLNQIFKTFRSIPGEVKIPDSILGRYEMTLEYDIPTDDIGVSYIPMGGYQYVQVTLRSLEMIHDADGRYTIIIYSEQQPNLYDLISMELILWNEGVFSTSYSAGNYSGNVSDNYKNAVELDFNTSNIFTVTNLTSVAGSGLGSVTITANYPNAVFSLAENTANLSVTISNVITVVGLEFLPATLQFNHKQNEPLPSLFITMTGDFWKVVGKPNFILTSATIGVAVTTVVDVLGTYQVVQGSGNAIISFKLADYYDGSQTFFPSDLAGKFAVLENNVPFGEIPYSVSVTRLSDFLTVPYIAGDKAFTLDNKFFEFKSLNQNTYFQFDATIKTYNFLTNEENVFLIPLKIILFKGYGKENLGQIIHRCMQKFITVNENLFQYKEAILKINCSEIVISDETILRSGTSLEIPFIAGISRGITSWGFLDFNPAPNRVTKNSFAYLNILVPAGNYELNTLKNGILISSEALPSSAGVVLCKKVFFKDYAQGDRIQFVIDLVGATTSNAPKKTYILFPDNNYSNMIVWENEFLLQSAIECTGSAALDSEGDFQSQTVYVDLVERLDHLSSSKNVKLLINTGWLLFSDIDTVESLMRSKRAWLVQGNSTISLRPISKKLPKKDLEEELISFPLEFKINQNYNEETYSL